MGLFSRNPPAASGMDALYQLPAGVGDPDAAVGGGYGSQPSALRRPVSMGANVALLSFKAFHYGESPLPGRTYSAYQPPLSFSTWLR